jgi:hypothetical protein
MWIDLHDRARLSLSAAARRSKKKKNECHALTHRRASNPKKEKEFRPCERNNRNKKIKDISLSPAEYYS